MHATTDDASVLAARRGLGHRKISSSVSTAAGGGSSGGGRTSSGGGGGGGGGGDGGDAGEKKGNGLLAGLLAGWSARAAYDPEFPTKVLIEQVRLKLLSS